MLFYSAVDIFRVDAPAKGGTLREGVIGEPSFINPILSGTDTGRDLAYLTYSGLMRINEHGELAPDLAESYTISDDGLVYTFKLRNDIYFHDNEKITADDVVFTITKTKDPRIKSPLAANWQGVVVKAIDERTIEFTLKSPYNPFLENTTIGIIPEHIWKDAVEVDQFAFSKYNFEPIGSGPYKVDEVRRGSDGSAVYYKLVAFSKYGPGEKNITNIYIHIYKDMESLVTALRAGDIDSAAALSPAAASQLTQEGFRIETTPMLRIFGVFFNQNQQTGFVKKEVRQSLADAVDKQRIIDKVLYSYADPEDSPLPRGISEDATTTDRTVATTTLSFTLSTSDNPELKAVADALKEQWGAIGVQVNVATLDPAELTRTVIRPRKYDALLFGEIVGRGNDLYPFWHSSERKDPGLNIAQYTNTRADALLQRARAATTTAEMNENLSAFEDIVKQDVPAAFLYSPHFIYVVPKELKGLKLPAIELANERWAGILASYINVRRVWK